MAKFDPAYSIVLRLEGGYQNNPADKGNYNSLGDLVGTKYGISAPVLEQWIGRPPTKMDMANLNTHTAKAIYYNLYWKNIQGDFIRSQDLANIFFDGHVNHGRTGIRLMQRVLGVSDDGIVGPITLNALNSSDTGKTYVAYRRTREAFYRQLATGSQAQFLNGWLRRLQAFTAYGGLPVASAPAGNATWWILGLVGLGILITR